MANKYVTDEARKQIGKTSEPRTYEVERGAIRRFAEAIEDRNPLFNSERDARQTRFGGMIAPPTFCRSMGAPIPDIKLDMPTCARPRRRFRLGILRADSPRRPYHGAIQARRFAREPPAASARWSSPRSRPLTPTSSARSARFSARPESVTNQSPKGCPRWRSKSISKTSKSAPRSVRSKKIRPPSNSSGTPARRATSIKSTTTRISRSATSLPGVILHGALKNAFLGHLMTDFAGELGWLRKLGVQYRGMDQPGTKVVARGKVSKKYTDGGWDLVDCEIWLENAKGEKTTPGSATVMLPSRARG